jgi:hypothetical protein
MWRVMFLSVALAFAAPAQAAEELPDLTEKPIQIAMNDWVLLKSDNVMLQSGQVVLITYWNTEMGVQRCFEWFDKYFSATKPIECSHFWQ